MMIVTATLLVTVIALVLGALLGWVAQSARSDDDALVEAIQAVLPQTQCAQCGYPGCRPYASAIAEGAPINRCPPGGETTIAALAALLGRPAAKLADDLMIPTPGLIARIDEQVCIGCALCLPACPVDAIVGAQRFTHTVLAAHCTGCELCLAPCPVDCIAMAPDEPARRLRWMAQ